MRYSYHLDQIRRCQGGSAILYPFFREPEVDWRWGSFFSIYDSQLAGNYGFKGKPDSQTTVEIGYEIHPTFQNRGFATKAACALVELALSAGVAVVQAHTYEATNASANVPRKAGCQPVGPVHDPDEGLLRAWLCTTGK